MKFKWGLLATFLFGLVFLFGCSSEGINEKLVIHGIGIDKENGKYTLTMHVLNTKALSAEGDNKDKEIIVVSGSGNSILDAIGSIEKISGKRALYSHNLILVIGKETAKTSTSEITEFFSSEYSLRPSVEVLIADSMAKDVMNVKNDDKLISADDIMNIVQTGFSKGNRLRFTLKNFLGDIENEYKAAKALCLNISKDELENKVLKVNEAAIFKDNYMASTLDEEETKGFLIISGKVKNMEQTIELNDKKLSCLIKKSKCKIKATVKDGKPTFSLHVKAAADIYDNSEKNSEDLKQAIKNKICNLMDKSIKKAVCECKCDIFNFSRYLVNADMRYFKDNMNDVDNILSDSDYDLSADVEVKYASKNSNLFLE